RGKRCPFFKIQRHHPLERFESGLEGIRQYSQRLGVRDKNIRPFFAVTPIDLALQGNKSACEVALA
ncbi:MAG: hypothetical protein L7T80_11310, partial [Arenicellales bacterium]|nr:hypothetical protein [Arenicellales bacterium]